jgi:hypothetical protein
MLLENGVASRWRYVHPQWTSRLQILFLGWANRPVKAKF